MGKCLSAYPYFVPVLCRGNLVGHRPASQPAFYVVTGTPIVHVQDLIDDPPCIAAFLEHIDPASAAVVTCAQVG